MEGINGLVAVSGIAAVLLSDLHLHPQDCVLLLLALPWLLDMVVRPTGCRSCSGCAWCSTRCGWTSCP
jgi:hypothetical protein